MLTPKKRLGQHFLTDKNIARKIVDGLTAGPEDVVVEIGPGTGALTSLLVDRYPRFSVIEVDERAADLLHETYPDLDIHLGDVLSFDWRQHAESSHGSLCVIGNLPYNITSQILFSLYDAAESIREAVVMMQYEVAQRLVAVPSTKAYGILSVSTQLLCEPKVLFPVSRNVFYPKPDVRSAVVRLDFDRRTVPMSEYDAQWTRQVVRRAFNQRRKTLRNSLKQITEKASTAIPAHFADKRAEELTPNDFVELAGYLHAGS